MREIEHLIMLGFKDNEVSTITDLAVRFIVKYCRQYPESSINSIRGEIWRMIERGFIDWDNKTRKISKMSKYEYVTEEIANRMLVRGM